MKSQNTKLKLHPRNKHRQRYDFDQLTQISVALAHYVRLNEYGDASIDFSDPKAVKSLNQALLKQFYGVYTWDIPHQYLCPPIPGRADYIHYLADLLHETHFNSAISDKNCHVLDIGVGANMIYPLIGQSEYGWQFVGCDIDPKALLNAQQLIDANQLSSAIELRLQTSVTHIFNGIIRPDDFFAITMCNPPFHGSLQEAQSGTARKWQGLNKQTANRQSANRQSAKLNFGGQSTELYCEGGENVFVRNMINESKQFAAQCLWFTTLVSKASNLPCINQALKKVSALEVRTINMAQGQKQSRMIAWTFLTPAQQQKWVAKHLMSI